MRMFNLLQEWNFAKLPNTIRVQLELNGIGCDSQINLLAGTGNSIMLKKNLIDDDDLQ